MAKTKKVVPSTNDDENNVEDKGGKSPSKEKKPAANLKNFKRVNNAPVAEMVAAALKQLKNDKGVALASIKRYIVQNYEVKMGKARQTSIRGFMTEEFNKGSIVMTNNDGDAIHFNMRFNSKN